MKPDHEFAQRLIAVERTCFVDWSRAMQAQPDNPFGVHIESFGEAIALLNQRIRQPVFNRVLQMRATDLDQLPAILELYHKHHIAPMFDLSPYTIEPFFERDGVPLALAKNGFYQAAFHQMLYAKPRTTDLPALPHGIEIRPVTHENAADFAMIFGAVKGESDSSAVLPIVDHPNFHAYLAYVEGQPAALGVLHISNGAGSMANGMTLPTFRGRGCQTALLYHRMKMAAEAGCDLLVSQCQPGTISQSNQLRVGFQIAGTKVWWIPMP